MDERFATSDMMLPSLEQHTGTLLKYNVSGKNQSNLIITSSKNLECIIELEAYNVTFVTLGWEKGF